MVYDMAAVEKTPLFHRTKSHVDKQAAERILGPELNYYGGKRGEWNRREIARESQPEEE